MGIPPDWHDGRQNYGGERVISEGKKLWFLHVSFVYTFQIIFQKNHNLVVTPQQRTNVDECVSACVLKHFELKKKPSILNMFLFFDRERILVLKSKDNELVQGIKQFLFAGIEIDLHIQNGSGTDQVVLRG